MEALTTRSEAPSSLFLKAAAGCRRSCGPRAICRPRRGAPRTTSLCTRRTGYQPSQALLGERQPA
ncbi:unnamed protein product, partial [Ectocarpus fasciculatus]